jgi:hypothetical protein
MHDSSSARRNTAAGSGGGIYNWEAALILNDSSSVSMNTTAGSGGGIFGSYAETTMNDASSVSGNTARYGGGGISNEATLTLNGSSSVTGNTATNGFGGGIRNRGLGHVYVCSDLVVLSPNDPDDPARLLGQQDAQQIRVGVEWVLIWGRVKLPLRAGYFNDRQITPNPTGDIPRFNGYTLGTGLLLGPLLVDVAYVHESGAYTVAPDSGDFDLPPDVTLAPVRNVLKTDRVFASLIYRFSVP